MRRSRKTDMRVDEVGRNELLVTVEAKFRQVKTCLELLFREMKNLPCSKQIDMAAFPRLS